MGKDEEKPGENDEDGGQDDGGGVCICAPASPMMKYRGTGTGTLLPTHWAGLVAIEYSR
jgi:hypothetical protein